METSERNPDINAVEEKILLFFENGEVRFIERKRGQSHQTLREDWEFISRGTYYLAKDTIHLAISEFETRRLNFEILKQVGDEGEWVEITEETGMTRLTDGSKDRTISVEVIKDDFSRMDNTDCAE
ncbi:hypothetical protein CHISP_3348 [Chitinispirillum alkaliphilum]|nr:hypothetical protein CHISP_3348 [Chitinispirillum alkaliphilum]